MSNQFFYVTFGLTACLAGGLMFTKLPTHTKLHPTTQAAKADNSRDANQGASNVKKKMDPVTNVNNKIITGNAKSSSPGNTAAAMHAGVAHNESTIVKPIMYSRIARSQSVTNNGRRYVSNNR